MSDDTLEWSLTDQPSAFIVFPIVVVLIGSFIAIILVRRRRRVARNGGRWPQDQAASRAGRQRQRERPGNGNSNRWTPWGATRSQEGLNELGEAPPPYDGKREGSSELQETEMRDLEAGTGRPPGYPAEPQPAATRDTRWA